MPENPQQRYKFFYLAALEAIGPRVHRADFSNDKLAAFAKALATEMESRSTSPGTNAIRDRDELAAAALKATISAIHVAEFTVGDFADRAFSMADEALTDWLS